MYKVTRVFTFSLIAILILGIWCSVRRVAKNVEMATAISSTPTHVPMYRFVSIDDVIKEPVVEDEPVFSLISDEDIALIALVTMAEAESECEEGMRLVIDTVLNRVDSEHFPDTVYDVIYQPYHFTPMWNGRVERCEVREDICQLVREELASRTNYDVIYFTADGYSKYGVPLFQVENHYFSSYD